MNIGDKLPDMLGLNEKGEAITRESLAGKKVVLYVYPKGRLKQVFLKVL